MKKITIKDVAREAGVSVATVSYIINNREDQKISPETRNKVLQIINLLDYTPNQAAKSLVTQKSQIVALHYKEAESYLQKAEQLHFI
ncbi:TPA: LacI family DNA-binding transcriptional regulator, partial [Streptococcus suis]